MGEALQWRSIGPHRGGRVTSVAGVSTRRLEFYFGSAGGGVWKTSDGGYSWHNVSDGYLDTASVGAVAVAPSHPDVVYAGMGEACIRGDVAPGDGVYVSRDAGRTWEHRGLAATRHIGRIVIDPTNPERVFVAALGHAFGPNPERGLFRSADGGLTWEHSLNLGPDTGVVDVAMDPSDPAVLYAAAWETRRYPWTFSSGGPGSGLFRSTDGGETWTNLSQREGMPRGVLGRLGVALTPADPRRIYAFIEAQEGGVFRSDDAGEHWMRVNADLALRGRPWYFSHIIADPVNRDGVCVLDLEYRRSTDGGRTFAVVPTAHADHHALWIDPADAARQINGHDGGAAITFDGGSSWSPTFNQPTAQFYHVATDQRVPYRVYGAQQDNSTLSIPSRTLMPAIATAEGYDVGGGESGYIAVRPDNPNIVYAGNYNTLTRYNHATGEVRSIFPWPEETAGHSADEVRYRFQWTFPIVVSPHDPDTLYTAAQVVFRSRDEGAHWEVISPDLTYNNRDKMQPSGGPITGQYQNVEYYGTVFALAESPLRRGLLWAGSDDGRIHVSENDGMVWRDVTPPDMAEGTLVSMIEASPGDAQTVYVAATRYKLDDPRPLLWKSTDLGRSWTAIQQGIAPADYTRVIRADPVRPGLLFCGTEQGVYVSEDDGGHWQSLRNNLPVTPIHDLVIHGPDVVVATHGRGFWILDDISPLRQPAAHDGRQLTLYTPAPAIRWHAGGGAGGRMAGAAGYQSLVTSTAQWQATPQEGGRSARQYLDAGQNPDAGVWLVYRLGTKVAAVELEIQDSHGRLAHRATWTDPEHTSPGLHRVGWDLHYPGPLPLTGPAYRRRQTHMGPMALPGRYRVRWTVGEESGEVPLDLLALPHGESGAKDLAQQFALGLRLRDLLSGLHGSIDAARALLAEVDREFPRAVPTDPPSADRLRQALMETLAGWAPPLEVHDANLKSHPAPLNAKIASLSATVALGDSAPNAAMWAVYQELRDRWLAGRQQLESATVEHVGVLNEWLQAQQRPEITVPSWPPLVEE